MNFLKRFVSVCLSAAALVIALAVPAAADGIELVEPYTLTGEELIDRIEKTYDEALDLAGLWSFHGRCSMMVNHSAVALGIRNSNFRLDGDGRDIYDKYSVMSRTDGGYDVVCYPCGEYDLESALNAVCEDGTRDVYNLLVCFEGGSTANSSSFGHALFVHGILGGMVYFSESYGLNIAGQYYSEGKPIVCTVAEFAEYYNKWAYFEGVIHMDFPDETAPTLSRLSLVDSSEEGFTLRCRAADNIGIVEMYAKVWPYGSTEEEAVTVPVSNVNGAVVVRMDTELFDGFNGRYYVNLYAVDRKGNVSVVNPGEEGICLYQVTETSGTYRVKGGGVGAHNAPYIRVNGAITREAYIGAGRIVEVVGSYANDQGENWYLLSDGTWILAERVRRTVSSWADLWDLMTRNFRVAPV